MTPSHIPLDEGIQYKKISTIKLKHRQKCYDLNNNSDFNVYDLLCPEEENICLQYIRKWERRMGFLTPLKWKHIIGLFLYFTVAMAWSLYSLTTKKVMWQTTMFAIFVGFLGGFGVTGGAHRFWSHKSYKAKKPLQLFLVFCFSTAGQNNIFDWVRDHRVHHKFSETLADPHDANRGFFFSHVGWLMMKKHPAVMEEGAKIDMSDIRDDPLIKFHTKYFLVFKLLFCFVLPPLVPALCWNETWELCIVSQLFIRYMLSLHATWSVNSFAHLWGNRPYDKNIMPSENLFVSICAIGEGWHNYHHTFPWDYKAAELPYTLNVTTMVLDMFAYIGWAYDMKTTSPELVKAVIENRGHLENKSL